MNKMKIIDVKVNCRCVKLYILFKIVFCIVIEIESIDVYIYIDEGVIGKGVVVVMLVIMGDFISGMEEVILGLMCLCLIG